MDSNRHILVTGTTGALGVEILRRLIKEESSKEARFLIRASSDQELRHRWRRVLTLASDGKKAPEDIPNFQPVMGDVTQANLGIGDPILHQIQNDATHIIHAAADVRFSAPLRAAMETNVEGTKNVLSFSKNCKRIEQIAHISTLFTSGRRSGTVSEEELEHDAGFVNNYEKTKFEAEVLVRKAMEELPIAIYRFALLPGTRGGYVHSFGSFHQGLHFYYYGLLPILPGLPDTLLELLPSDYAAEVMSTLFFRHFRPGKTYQICNGKDAIPLKDFLELCAHTFSDFKPSWKTGTFEPPEIVDMETYELFTKSAQEVGNITFKHIARVMNSFIHQMVYPKVFTSDLVDASINGCIQKPSIRDFFPNVIRYSVATDWGRKIKDGKLGTHEDGRVREAAD